MLLCSPAQGVKETLQVTFITHEGLNPHGVLSSQAHIEGRAIVDLAKGGWVL